ncbi:unnamed protein product [Trichogramma brassicae]|uniref:Uncharacterized protein n=1 Tax=Trichogramma brassicae TaxID=86971 RepID=A0A6H5J285_9HYME|nr:unnamed protein product [Trichogramma brassicae]
MAEHVGDFSSDSGSDGGSTSNHGGHEITDKDVEFWKKVKKELKKKWARRSVEHPCADLLETERRLDVYDTCTDSDNFCDDFSDELNDGLKQESDSERSRDASSKFSREGSSRDEVLDAFQAKVKRLKYLRRRIDWNVKKSRREIYRLLDHSITDWQGRLPSLRDIFEDEEIERLMFDRGDDEPGQVPVRKFIEFAISTGYKDEPKLDEATGKPLLRRATPIHRAARLRYPRAVVELFKIYDRYDVNYSDEAGLTHFHLACACGCRDVVEKFLLLGRADPNVAAKKGVSPLHLALAARRDEVAALLLRHGADPNAANGDGSTALHEICRSYLDNGFVELFFRINDEKHRRVQIDAKDKRGRSPLQLAVANLQSKTVDVLLDRGADLSSFVFPTEDYFAKGFDTDDFALKSVSRTLSIVGSLERKGYKLKPSDALTIIKFFYEHGLFRPDFELDAYLRYHKRFVKAAKKSRFAPGLSLHDLLRLPLDEAEKVLEAADYSRFDDLTEDWRTLLRDHVPCTLYLCEIMTSGFVQRWPREFYRYIFLNKK